MKPIPQADIDAMPTKVEPTRSSCELAADKTLYVLFLIGGQVDQEWPLIVSNGVEVYPLPAPYESDEESPKELLGALNGESGLLTVSKVNANAFNQAIADGAKEEAEEIVDIASSDSAAIWSSLNALAATVETGKVYRTLALSEKTKAAYPGETS